MKHEDMTDAQMNELLLELQQRLETHQSIADAPELRMVHDIRSAYQTEISEDALSLERVLTKLKKERAEAQPMLLFPPVYQHKERVTIMQSNLEIPTQNKKSKKWPFYAVGLVAVLFLTLIIGGLITGLHAGPTNRTATSSTHVASNDSNIAGTFASLTGLSANANQTKTHFSLSLVRLGGLGNKGSWAIGVGTNLIKGHLVAKAYTHGQKLFEVTEDYPINGKIGPDGTKAGPKVVFFPVSYIGKNSTVDIYVDGKFIETTPLITKFTP